MPVEIRELVIKGSVSNDKTIESKFNEIQSPLLDSQLIEELKEQILREVEEKINNHLEKKRYF